MIKNKRHEINLTILIDKLTKLQGKADGGMAHVIELLLLENHLPSRDVPLPIHTPWKGSGVR